jgi:hypothetical protein
MSNRTSPAPLTDWPRNAEERARANATLEALTPHASRLTPEDGPWTPWAPWKENLLILAGSTCAVLLLLAFFALLGGPR